MAKNPIMTNMYPTAKLSLSTSQKMRSYPKKRYTQLVPGFRYTISRKATTGTKRMYSCFSFPFNRGISTAPRMNIRAGGRALIIKILAFLGKGGEYPRGQYQYKGSENSK